MLEAAFLPPFLAVEKRLVAEGFVMKYQLAVNANKQKKFSCPPTKIPHLLRLGSCEG